MVDLSVIILSYNTKDITKQCLDSLIHCLKLTTILYEIIVVDNNSTDGSKKMLEEYDITHLFLSKNIGYSKANNKGLAIANGRFTLFLNSDVLHDNVNYDALLSYMISHKSIGALTVRVELTKNKIDPASHRGFPTIWRSFCYYLKLESLLGAVPGLNRLFGGYHLTYLDLNTVHEIEALSGAYFLSKTRLLKQIGGFDEDYFMYGEDLDLAFRIQKQGYKNIYYPNFTVTHLKYQSGIKNKNKVISKEIRRHFYQSMKIFYQKHYEKKYPRLVNLITYAIINRMIQRVWAA